MVAVVALCLDRIHHIRHLHLHDGSHRRYVPYQLPVVTRASFGIWGSLWPVFNRAAMACVWYGVQSWIGGTYLANDLPKP